MTEERLNWFGEVLRQMVARLDGDIDQLVDQTRTATGGPVVGNLSNAPIHLGDIGTEQYLQELNATLLEN